MEDEVLANAGVDVFEEIFKLIYTKLYDEKMSANDKKRFLQFRNYGETDAELKETIQEIFDKAKDKWQGIFAADEKIKLTPSHLAICISSLQNVKLFNSNLEVIDEAFEYLMSKSQKGEKGQYFTPRYVIDMCVKMLNPKIFENMIDTAAGSCGFPVHTIFHVWRENFGDNELFTAENKPPEFAEYVQKKIFAIDFDEKAVRVARTLNLIAGDGKTNVLHLNTLDYERWEEIIDDDWREIYFNGWIKLQKLRAEKNDNKNFNFDIVMANPPFAGDIKESRIISKYELGKNSKGKYQNKVGRDILFIERNLNFLKPGGRMAIILPQGRFNNSSDKYIRDFIAERCRILAVVGLHGNVFKPHTGTKTSVLFVQKWDEKICPRREDYPIFFATMQKPSKDNSGEKIYLTDGENFLRDKHNHLIVDHDLFNHDGLTHDGIAEAFIEFAKKENLSFFDCGSFDEEKYKNLSEELEVTEIFFSNLDFKIRWDTAFFLKKDIKKIKILSKFACKKLSEIAFVTDGEHGSPDFDENSNINYVTAEFIKPNEILDSPMQKISAIQDKKNSRCRLKENDILIYSVGAYSGYVCCAEPHLFPANIPRSVGLIRLKNFSEFLPGFVSIFLNSKYGNFQSCRLRAGNAQPVLAIENIKSLFVPKLEIEFQQRINNFYWTAYQKRQQAQEKYKLAEKILSEELGLEKFKPSTENIAVKKFSASFLSSGRLDAEFYQPKYDDLKKFLKKFQTVKLGDIVKIFKSIEPGSEFYSNEGVPFVRVSDITKFEIVEPEIKLSMQVDKKLFPREDTILFSKDGTVGIAYKVRKNLNAVTSGALLHLTIIDKNFLPDFLTLILNSKIIQMQAERDTNGAIIQHWKISDIEKILIPKISEEVQEKISELVEESFLLRGESKKLLDGAKKLVELEIESS